MAFFQTLLTITAIITAMLSLNQSNFWGAMLFMSTAALLIIIAKLVHFHSRIFPYGTKGKINKIEFKKTSYSIIAFISFFIFSSYIWHIFYKKSYGIHSSLFLGFIAGSIVWALISLFRKFYKKTSKISFYQNIFAIFLLIVFFIYGKYSIETELAKGKDSPYAFDDASFLIISYNVIIKNFKGLILFKKVKTETKIKIIEISIYTIFLFLFIVLKNLGQFKVAFFVILFGFLCLIVFQVIKPSLLEFIKKYQANKLPLNE